MYFASIQYVHVAVACRPCPRGCITQCSCPSVRPFLPEWKAESPSWREG